MCEETAGVYLDSLSKCRKIASIKDNNCLEYDENGLCYVCREEYFLNEQENTPICQKIKEGEEIQNCLLHFSLTECYKC